MAQPGDTQHGEADPIKLAREALNERMTKEELSVWTAQNPRDDLALAMFAAWVNCSVEQLPPDMKGHTCPATMRSWCRVAQAALDAIPRPAPVPGDAELDALVQEARELARDEFAAGHNNSSAFHGNVAAAMSALRTLLAEVEGALEPFCFYSDEPNTAQDAWEIRYQGRFHDWISFDDIEAARAAHRKLKDPRHD